MASGILTYLFLEGRHGCASAVGLGGVTARRALRDADDTGRDCGGKPMSNALIESSTSWAALDPPERLRSVLIAEDDPVMAASLAKDVRTLGYEVIGPVGDGQQAIDLARTQRPDLALLDIMMPVLGGFGAATVLFRHMDVPVVMVSAHTESEYAEAGRRLGVYGYLIKPVSVDHLRFGITVAWSRFLERQQLRGQVRTLQEALEDRKYIERAKGILMDKLGLTERGAMRRLQQQARDARRRLADAARAIVESDKLFSEPSRRK